MGLLTKDPQKRLAWPHLEHHPYLAKHKNIHDIPYRPGTSSGRPSSSRPATARADGTTATQAEMHDSPTRRGSKAADAWSTMSDADKAVRSAPHTAPTADTSKASARERRRRERAERIGQELPAAVSAGGASAVKRSSNDHAFSSTGDSEAEAQTDANMRPASAAAAKTAAKHHEVSPLAKAAYPVPSTRASSTPVRRDLEQRTAPPSAAQVYSDDDMPLSSEAQALGSTYRMGTDAPDAGTQQSSRSPPRTALAESASRPSTLQSLHRRQAWRTASAQEEVKEDSRFTTADSSTGRTASAREDAVSIGGEHAPDILVVEPPKESVDVTVSLVSESQGRVNHDHDGFDDDHSLRGSRRHREGGAQSAGSLEVAGIVTAAIGQLHEHLAHGDDRLAAKLLVELHEVVPHVEQPEAAALLLEAFAPSLLVLLQKDARDWAEDGPTETDPVELAIESALDLAAVCLSHAGFAAHLLNNVILRFNLARFVVARLAAPADEEISEHMLLLSVHFLSLCVHATLDLPPPQPGHAIFAAMGEMRREVAAALCDASGSFKLLARQLRHRHNHQALQVRA